MRRGRIRRVLWTAGLAACLCGRALPALDPSRALAEYGHDAWRIEDGLPQDTVEAIAQTSDGYLWIGTQRGLARFDGVRFTVHAPGNPPALRSGAIDSLLADPDGSLWVSTDGGGLAPPSPFPDAASCGSACERAPAWRDACRRA